MKEQIVEKMLELYLRSDQAAEKTDESQAVKDVIVGKKMFFRTVTFSEIGEVVDVVGDFAILKNASWVADTGRFNDFLKDGVSSDVEIEPYPDMVMVSLKSVTSMTEWEHDLPSKQQ